MWTFKRENDKSLSIKTRGENREVRDHSHLPEVGSRGLLDCLGCGVGATGGGGSLCSRAGGSRSGTPAQRAEWVLGQSDGALGGAGVGAMGRWAGLGAE